MIFVAAAVILFSAVQRFLNPQPLENVGVGLAISVAASVGQRRGGRGAAARRGAVPVDHPDRRRQAPDDRRVDLGGRRGRGAARLG